MLNDMYFILSQVIRFKTIYLKVNFKSITNCIFITKLTVILQTVKKKIL